MLARCGVHKRSRRCDTLDARARSRSSLVMTSPPFQKTDGTMKEPEDLAARVDGERYREGPRTAASNEATRTALREAWDAGVMTAKRYGDNVHHLGGAQADAHFESFLKARKAR
jgi:hypothetical protein